MLPCLRAVASLSTLTVMSLSASGGENTKESYKCLTSRNKCIAISNKCHATRNKKLVVTKKACLFWFV